MVTGAIRNPYDQSRSVGRSAIPSYAGLDKRYVVTATADGVTINGTGNTTNNTFSIPLSIGKKWTITVELQKKESGDSDYVKVMEGSFTFSEPLSEVTSGITIEIKPTISGIGNIDLTFTPVGDTVIYDSVAAEPVSTTQKTEWSAHVTASTTGISGTGIKSGVYSVTISFYLSNVLVYATMQEITVYDNMTTNVWDGSGSNSPINSDGTFKVTADLTERFKLTNYFVKSDGNNNNSGTPYYPIKTINEALRRINVTGESDKDYIIWLMSDITASVSLAESSYLSDKASSITIRPMRNQVTVSGSSSKVFDIRVPVPFTFENLTITGGAPSAGLGGAIHIESNAKVTLSNCTITGNASPSDSNGGGIFNCGTLNVKGKVIISGNTKGSGSNAAENNVFLYENAKINIVGALDPDSRIGVITGTKPSYGNPRVFTSGFSTKSGLDASLISTIFTCDEGYAVVAGSGSNAGEATLEASGGGINNAFDYAVTLSCAESPIATGSIFSISAAVKKGVDTVAITEADDITWNFKLYCCGDEVATLPGAAGVGYGTCIVPANVHIFGGVNYTLHATAVYGGVAYDKDFTLTGYSSTVPYGFVAVTGAIVTGAVSGSYVFTGSPIEIPNMYVCDHEVTQAEYLAVMGLTQESILSEDFGLGNNYPAYNMSWYDMIVYCNKRSIAEGLTPCYTIKNSTNPAAWGDIPTASDDYWNAVTCDFSANGYRLPTEAEWEYAARGGNNGIPATQTTYSGSNTPGDVAWYKDNSKVNNVYSSHEVKGLAPNALGIYDMSGNVWERCWDLGTNNQGKEGRAVRGGSSTCSYTNCYVCGMEYYDVPELHKNDDGFRVVRTAWSAYETPVTLPANTNGTAGTSATYMLFGTFPQSSKEANITVNETVSREVGAYTYYLGSDYAWYAKTGGNYFKVEPIKWCVINSSYDHDNDSSTPGKKLLLAENSLVACVFYDDHDNRTIGNETISADNYQYSRIRAYLNGETYKNSGGDNNQFDGKGMLQTAFTSAAVNLLIENNSVFDDKLFLLSYDEVSSISSTRIREETNFANGNSETNHWWIRTPRYENNYYIYYVDENGSLANGSSTNNRDCAFALGVVPALCLE